MFQRIVRLAALSGLLVALAACGTQAGAPPQPTAAGGTAAPAEAFIGAQFQLAIGEQATLDEAGLSLSFAAVLEDSRCPADALCVQQGRAVVSGELVDGAGTAPYTLTLGGADDAGAELAAGGYSVRIVALDPYPGTVDQVAPEDYRLTLIVEKAGA